VLGFPHLRSWILPFCRSTIKDKIIPHAVSWFTGEALQGEDLEDEDEEDNEDDEEDEDEDEDDDEENEDEEEDEEDDDEEEVHAQKVQSLLYSSSFSNFGIINS
jgi:hypothetical protein